MGFRYDLRGKSPQTQAMVRKRDKEDALKREESKKQQREQELRTKVVNLLKSKNSSMDVHEISKEINEPETEVLKVINKTSHNLMERVLSENNISSIAYKANKN